MAHHQQTSSPPRSPSTIRVCIGSREGTSLFFSSPSSYRARIRRTRTFPALGSGLVNVHRENVFSYPFLLLLLLFCGLPAERRVSAGKDRCKVAWIENFEFCSFFLFFFVFSQQEKGNEFWRFLKRVGGKELNSMEKEIRWNWIGGNFQNKKKGRENDRRWIFSNFLQSLVPRWTCQEIKGFERGFRVEIVEKSKSWKK